MNLEDKQQLSPADEAFPYTLEVNDHHDGGYCEFPRYGWACLWRHEPEKPVCDANPYPQVYVQEQTFTHDDYAESDEFGSTEFPIASDGVTYPYQIENFDGWEEGPSRLWDFIETVRDEYYEAGVDPETLPVRVITHRNEDTDPESPYDEEASIYFRSGANDIEYIMWHSHEMYYPSGVNSELIQKILSALGDAYEEPAKFISNWEWHQVQIESDIDV